MHDVKGFRSVNFAASGLKQIRMICDFQKKCCLEKCANIRYEERCGSEVNIISPGGSHRDLTE